MTWIKNTGQKPDLPDNQWVQVIYNDGGTLCAVAESHGWRITESRHDIAFYRTIPIIDGDQDWIPIIDNKRPDGLHDEDEIEILWGSGTCYVNEVVEIIFSMKDSETAHFYRIVKKYEAPKELKTITLDGVKYREVGDE